MANTNIPMWNQQTTEQTTTVTIVKILIRILLVALVVFGLWGAARLSFDQYQTGEACPIVGNTVAACYIAFFGYVLIAVGVAMSLGTTSTFGSFSFWTGTAITGGLAALASILELVNGDICPVAFGSVPMCYISLAFSLVITVLYLLASTNSRTNTTDL